MASRLQIFLLFQVFFICAIHHVAGKSLKDTCQQTCKLHEFCDTTIDLCADCSDICHKTHGTTVDCLQSCPSWCRHVRQNEDSEYRTKYHFCWEPTYNIDDPPEALSGSGSGQGDSEGGDVRDDGMVDHDFIDPVEPLPVVATTIPTTTVPKAVTTEPPVRKTTPCPKTSDQSSNLYVYIGFAVIVLVLVITNIVQCVFLRRKIQSQPKESKDHDTDGAASPFNPDGSKP